MTEEFVDKHYKIQQLDISFMRLSKKMRGEYAYLDREYKTLKQLIDGFNPTIDMVTKKLSPLKMEIKSIGQATFSLNKLIHGFAEKLGKSIGYNIIGKTESLNKNDIIGNLSKIISGMFGGARAGGGSVAPGKYYMVGERGPELFSPSTNGNIIPNHAIKQTSPVNIVMNINASDAGSFRKSQGQIFAEVNRILVKAQRNL